MSRKKNKRALTGAEGLWKADLPWLGKVPHSTPPEEEEEEEKEEEEEARFN